MFLCLSDFLKFNWICISTIFLKFNITSNAFSVFYLFLKCLSFKPDFVVIVATKMTFICGCGYSYGNEKFVDVVIFEFLNLYWKATFVDWKQILIHPNKFKQQQNENKRFY